MKIRLDLDYDGRGFHGWQRQPGLVTVQGCLEAALSLVFSAAAKKVGETPAQLQVTGAGRTDAGVSARSQVASFTWPDSVPCDCYRLCASLNGLTPPQLNVSAVRVVDDNFDARFSPHLKCYIYSLSLGRLSGGCVDRSWVVGRSLDIPAMLQAAKAFVGRHDFAASRASDCTAQSTERSLLISEFSRPDIDTLRYAVVGNGFLKQMVRIMVGTLVEVGLRRRRADGIAEILGSRQRASAGVTAPAEGLRLEWIRYGVSPGA